MRYFLIILVSFILSCADSEKKDSKDENLSKEDSISEVKPVIETTAMTIMPFSKFPEPFYGDTTYPIFPDMKMFLSEGQDSLDFNYYFESWFPQSLNMKHEKFNKGIKKMVDDYFSDYRVTDEYSSFGFWCTGSFLATDFNWISDKYCGVLFTEQGYFDGSAHYNHSYYSYHFDFMKNKQINLTDVLLFKSGEAQKFCDAFNPDPTTTINEIILEGDDFSAERPFMTTYGELYLYFSDYEKGPSMTRVMIPYSKFKGYVNPEYKFLFEH